MAIKLAFNKVINKSIKFYEDKHVYSLYNKDGIYEKDLISGTSFISNFFPKFERDLIASRVAKRDNKTVQEVIAEWSATAKIATDFGTKVHLFGEMYLTGGLLPIAETEKEEAYFLSVKNYLDTKLNNGWDLVNAEKIVFNNYIAGTADILFVNHKQKLYSLEDFKTNKKIDLVSYSGNEYGFDPIQSLQNCSYSKYNLQLALYTYLLKQGGWLDYPSYSIDSRILHINTKNIEIFVAPYDHEPYIKKMIQKQFNIRVR